MVTQRCTAGDCPSEYLDPATGRAYGPCFHRGSSPPPATPGPDADRLAEIEKRAERATPGPWSVDRGALTENRAIWGSDGICVGIAWHYHNAQPNAEFMAEARQDIPWLLSVLAARDAELSALVRERDEYRALALAAEGVLVDAPALAVRERERAEVAEGREQRLREVLEPLADVAQFVLDRITEGATSEERFAMKDAARIAMDAYRRALAGDAGARG
jgi:hypothetical protein